MRKSLGVNHISEGSKRTILNQKLAQFNQNNNTYSEQWPSLWRTIPLWASLSTKWVHYGTFFRWKGPSYTMEVVMLSSQRVNNVASQCGCICKGEYEVEPVAFFAFSCLLWHSNHEITPGPHVKALFFRHMCFFAKNAPEKNEQLNNGWANISWSIWGKLWERAYEIYISKTMCAQKII